MYQREEFPLIVALRNEKGSYNTRYPVTPGTTIVALRNEKGSYNQMLARVCSRAIVALRNEKGGYKISPKPLQNDQGRLKKVSDGLLHSVIIKRQYSAPPRHCFQ